MRGRIFKIKKTTLLKLSFCINLLFYIIFTILSFICINIPNLWFFGFCFFIGVYLIIRSILFALDSSCYFGILLLCIGLFNYYSSLFDIINFGVVFVVLSFSIASLFTYYFFNQTFHLFLSISIYFVALDVFVFILNLISIWIFLAILSIVVISLISRYLIIG